MKKFKLSVVLFLLSAIILSNSAQATGMSSRYIGVETIAVSLSIDSGKAHCVAQASSSSNNYKPSLIAVLKKSTNLNESRDASNSIKDIIR